MFGEREPKLKGEIYVERKQQPGAQQNGRSSMTQNEIEQVAGARTITFASVIFTGPVNKPDERVDT